MATGLLKLIAAPTLIIFGAIGAGPVAAQVTLDGTANPNFSAPAPFEAGNYDLRAELGRRAGPNLFHSFEKFSLRGDERATFSGPGEIERIISRVTGGERSRIDGAIRSTIPGADFYFINPAGIAFGPNASLDLQGSFHVSTADELRFADGARFSVLPVASSFTVAAPEAFGFLSANPVPIVVDQSFLQVGAGQTLSLTGGDIDIAEGSIRAEAGQITLAASAGPASLDIASGELSANQRADITIHDQTVVDTSGTGGGTIRIRGGNVLVEDESLILAINVGVSSVDGLIDVDADLLSVTDGSVLVSDAVGVSLFQDRVPSQLIPIPQEEALNVSPLRASCGARRDIGTSSFTGVGRGGLPPSPDGPLASEYVVDEVAVAEAHTAESRPVMETAPADIRVAALPPPCMPLD